MYLMQRAAFSEVVPKSFIRHFM